MPKLSPVSILFLISCFYIGHERNKNFIKIMNLSVIFNINLHILFVYYQQSDRKWNCLTINGLRNQFRKLLIAKPNRLQWFVFLLITAHHFITRFLKLPVRNYTDKHTNKQVKMETILFYLCLKVHLLLKIQHASQYKILLI